MPNATRIPTPPLPRQRLRGTSLVELVMFIVVLGLGLAGVMQVFATAVRASADPQIQRQALAIAESLMEEVQLMPLTYCDPDDANVEGANSPAECSSMTEGIGPNAGESRFGTPQFDNVGDYHGYGMAGIVDITGTPVAGLSGYSASVSVVADALGSIGAASGDALRITVTVTGPNGASATLDGYRTRHAPNSAY
jgi:MSHA pilin protein MshD